MTSQSPSPTSKLRFEDLRLPTTKTCCPRKQTRSRRQQKKSTETFHFFTELPTELRLKIYTLSLPSTRLVPIQYLSATQFSSPCPSPTRFTSPDAWRTPIWSPSSLSLPPQNNTPRNRSIGCTSPATIPTLLHVCHESRILAMQHYTLSFPLQGPADIFPSKIWFSNPLPFKFNDSISSPSTLNSNSESQVIQVKGEGTEREREREQDILYFPPQSGYIASFKHWTHIQTLVSSSSLQHVRRLAVHEDLFLEEQKRHSSQNSGLGWETAHSAWGSGNGDNLGGWRGGADTWVENRLRDFWRDVSRRFQGVREVWIVGEGREEDVLSLSVSELSSFQFPENSTSTSDSSFQSNSFSDSVDADEGCVDSDSDMEFEMDLLMAEGEEQEEETLCSIVKWSGIMVCRRRDIKGCGWETFNEKVRRIVCEVEMESEGWTAPEWRVLSADFAGSGRV